MKKILSITALAAVLLFQGCSSGPEVRDDSVKLVNTYFTAPYINEKTVSKKLEKAGFEILGVQEKVSKTRTTIVFTHPKLIELANRPKRGFLAGALRVLVNKEDGEIRIHNPYYFIKAFLQEEYKVGDEKEIMASLFSAFPNLSISSQKTPTVKVYELKDDKETLLVESNLKENGDVNIVTKSLAAGEHKIKVLINDALGTKRLLLEDNINIKVGEDNKVNAKLAYKVNADSSLEITGYKSFSDEWKEDGLANYHFMISMPYYPEFDELGEGKSIDSMYKKLEKKVKKKNIVYFKKLSEQRAIVGVQMKTRTEKFAAKIGADKSGILPWQILFEEVEVDGKKVIKAFAQNAQYLIAISYPLLDMGGFMGIMSIPGTIESELSKPFKH